jgi:thiol-disulfide isomerase/thioredoxin
MKKAILLLSFFLFAFYCNAQGQKIKSYSADDLLQRVSNKDTVYIVNFWATWCIPCVKELPSFNMVHDLYKGKPVKVLLVSFDFKEQYPAKLQAWVSKKKLHPEVVWFSETNPNEYIPKIAPEWEGGLPATLMINNKTGEHKLKSEEISTDELKEWIEAQLK